MRFRRFIYLGGAFLLVIIKFAIDVIAKNVDLDLGGIGILRELLVAGAFVLLYLVISPVLSRQGQNPAKKLGLVLILTTVLVLVGIVASSLSLGGFDTKGRALSPLDYPTLFIASFISLAFGLFALFILGMLRGLVLYNRRRGGRRNFFAFVVLLLSTALSTVMLKPLESSTLSTVLFAFAVAFAVMNSFRLPWIISLTKREKVFTLVYGFFLFLLFTGLNILIDQSSAIGRSLLYYSNPLTKAVFLATIFANVYFGMTFVSTLFHLPTAEAFDRKRSEVTSLHNLSRLVTQVFDFNELVDTVTTMTLDVCEAKSCWLEIIHETPDALPALRGRALNGQRSGYVVQVAGMKNISEEEIGALVSTTEQSLRDVVIEERKPIVVDDVRSDARFRRLKSSGASVGSMVVVPLVSHGGMIGVLYATKEVEYGFVKDDVDVISAFADQATVAIENSRLIKKSIERERLLREVMVAQEMQKKLLPQVLPSSSAVEIDAVSTPAFEVGGDYYDFVHLDPRRIGIVVGDVSGKGVSAAFYMSEVKGIFQALSRMYPSPRDFMIKANDALAGSIDKHSFVSLIYAILDVSTGRLTLARAGHCPMLLVSDNGVQYIRPGGMGLGLTEGRVFEEAIEEHALQLTEGDICVFYTDGLTEARNVADEEFGYERLLSGAQHAREQSATGIKDEILSSVRLFSGAETHHDDLTLVVLKWRGAARGVDPDIA
jgi:sigma-B regulation protein RsbU (phosphoserine phosphatase)